MCMLHFIATDVFVLFHSLGSFKYFIFFFEVPVKLCQTATCKAVCNDPLVLLLLGHVDTKHWKSRVNRFNTSCTV